MDKTEGASYVFRARLTIDNARVSAYGVALADFLTEKITDFQFKAVPGPTEIVPGRSFQESKIGVYPRDASRPFTQHASWVLARQIEKVLGRDAQVDWAKLGLPDGPPAFSTLFTNHPGCLSIVVEHGVDNDTTEVDENELTRRVIGHFRSLQFHGIDTSKLPSGNTDKRRYASIQSLLRREEVEYRDIQKAVMKDCSRKVLLATGSGRHPVEVTATVQAYCRTLMALHGVLDVDAARLVPVPSKLSRVTSLLEPLLCYIRRDGVPDPASSADPAATLSAATEILRQNEILQSKLAAPACMIQAVSLLRGDSRTLQRACELASPDGNEPYLRMWQIESTKLGTSAGDENLCQVMKKLLDVLSERRKGFHADMKSLCSSLRILAAAKEAERTAVEAQAVPSEKPERRGSTSSSTSSLDSIDEEKARLQESALQ